MIFDILLNSNLEKTEVVEFYKTLLENQSSNFSTLIVFFVSITTILVGISFLWNFIIAKNQIKNEVFKQVKEIEAALNIRFQQLVKEDVEKVEKKFEKDLVFIKGESARSFFIQSFNMKLSKSALTWLSTALDYYLTIECEEAIRGSINSFLTTLKQPDLKKEKEKNNFNINEIISIVNKVPVLLSKEKTEIIDLLIKLKE